MTNPYDAAPELCRGYSSTPSRMASDAPVEEDFDDLETLLAAVEASPEYAYEKRIAELEHQLAALSPSPTAPTVEEVARAHWDSERETLRERSGGWFDAGPWEEADPDTRTMRLSAAARIIELFQGKAR